MKFGGDTIQSLRVVNQKEVKNEETGVGEKITALAPLP